MSPNPQETADLVTVTGEILNGKLHFLRETNLLFLSLLNLPKFFKRGVSSNFNTLLLKTYTW